VKLPKSFLAVNLSETHTFHKKEELEEDSKEVTTKAETATPEMVLPIRKASH
jgi:inositol hexakisphosphate/diphosphoinositol-pentakisphosphate kinase